MEIKIKNQTKIYYFEKKTDIQRLFEIIKDIKIFLLEENILNFKSDIIKYSEEHKIKIEDINKEQIIEIKKNFIENLFKTFSKTDFFYIISTNLDNQNNIKLNDILIIFMNLINDKIKIKFIEEKILTDKEQELKQRIENDFNINIF